jgi:hypothetical protein
MGTASQIAPQRLFALAASGKRSSITAPASGDMIAEAYAALAKQGFTDADLKSVILSPSELEEFGPSPVRSAPLQAKAHTAHDPTAPPVPKPTSKDDITPNESSDLLISANNVDLFFRFNGGAFMPVNNPPAQMRLDPPFPAGAKIAYKRHWHKVYGTTIHGPQHFSKEISTTHGMSETNSQELSAELGVDIKGLSGKLSATTTHSITISDESKVTDTYSFDVPKHKVCVYSFWELVEVFALVDAAGNPISWQGGVWLFNLAKFSADFPNNRFTSLPGTFASDPVMFHA